MAKIKIVFLAFMILMVCVGSGTASAALQKHYFKYRIEYFVAQKSFMEKYLPFLKFASEVPLSGKIAETLRRNDDGTWLLERSGLIYGFKAREFSQFRTKGSTIEPIWYFRNQTGIFRDSRAEVKFPKGNTTVFDPMTFALRISLDLQTNSRSKTFVYKMADAPDNVKLHTYAVTAKEAIETDIGTMLTVVVARLNSDNVGTEYVFWFAPELNYMIVRRMTIEDGEKRIESNIKEGSIGGRKL